MLLRPLPRRLLKRFAVSIILLRNTALDGILRHRLGEQLTRKRQHRRDARRGLPFLLLQHAQTHGALVVVGDVGVVDLGREGENGRLERVVCREGEGGFECAALSSTSK